MAESGIVGVVLAAGSGRRFGGDKLLARLADGAPLAAAAAARIRPACDRLIAVVRYGDDALAAVLAAAGCEVIRCRDAAAGMGHSLATAVRATGDASAWLVTLGDMPFIASTTHLAVASRLRAGASLAASQYRGQRGHPVGFARVWYSELSTLTGDQGGRTLLQKYADRLVLCPVDDPGVLRDIDTRHDLRPRAA